MSGRNFEKAAARDAGRFGQRYRPVGDGKPSTTEDEVKLILLGSSAIRCRRCPELFTTDGSEARARPIHLCAGCREEVEEEAAINGLPLTASDDDLTTALATIARCESGLVRATRQRRIDRLEGQLADIRRELAEKMSGSIWERTAA